jgi:hypothetical protein
MKTFWAVFFAILAAMAVAGVGLVAWSHHKEKQAQEMDRFEDTLKLISTTIQLVQMPIVQNDPVKLEQELGQLTEFVRYLDPYLANPKYRRAAQKMKDEAELQMEIAKPSRTVTAH